MSLNHMGDISEGTEIGKPQGQAMLFQHKGKKALGHMK